MKRRPALLSALVLLVLAVGAWVYLQVRDAQETRQRRQDLLADVDRELAKERPEGSELSRLVTRIQKAGDPARDDDLRRALARIENARGRIDKAWEYLEPLALAMEPRPADQVLGARLLAELHAHTGDEQKLRQALELAEAGYRGSGDVAVLLLAWQCAERLQDSDERQRLGDRIIADAPGSPAADLVALLRRPPEEVAADELTALASRFAEVPLELSLALARTWLLAGQVAQALRELDQALARAPSLINVRNAAATACYLFLQQGSSTSEAERNRRRAQMREHARWLLDHAPADDARRANWQAMLEAR